jgi:hypothetical protein
MIKLDLLDALSDKELDEVEAYSQALKARRNEDRRTKAMDEAKAILAAAGINLKDLSGRTKTKARSDVRGKGRRTRNAEKD